MARKKKATVQFRNPEGAHVRFGVVHLRERLAWFKGLMLHRAVRKDLSCYHFEVTPEGRAFVSASDLESRMRVNLEVVSKLGFGRLMLDTHALNALLGAYPAPTIEFSFDSPKDAVLATGHQVKLILPGHDPEKECKIAVEGPLSPEGWFVVGDDLARALERTRFATDPTSTRYALGYVQLEFPEEGDAMDLVATDGRRLARVRIPVRRHGSETPARAWKPADPDVVDSLPSLPKLNHKMLPVVLKLARQAGPRYVAFSVVPAEPLDLEKKTFTRGLLQFVTPDVVLTMSGPDDLRFPRYEDVFPTECYEARLGFPSAGILGDFMEAAVAATDSESRGVEMVMAGGMLMMYAEAGTRGKTELALPVPDHEGRGTIDIDPRYLRDFLRACGEEPIEVRFFSKKLPLWFLAPGYDFIVMPLDRREPEPTPPAEPATEAPAEEPAEEPELCSVCLNADATPGTEPPVCEACQGSMEPDDDESDDDGGIKVEPAEPEPVTPAGATVDAHEGNGKAKKPSRNGRKKK